jgi:thiamine pyrophosphokinase
MHHLLFENHKIYSILKKVIKMIKCKKAVLIAAGEYNNEYQYNPDDYIIAIDGGYDHLINQGITPDLLIGDLDSIKAQIKPSQQLIKLPKEKDDTDSLYALKEAIKRGFNYFELYGFLGNKFNHSIANIQCLLYLKKEGFNGIIFNNNECYEILHNENKNFSNKLGYISVFSLSDSSIVTLKGLKYPLDKKELTSSFPLGIDNEFIINKKASVEVHQGYVLIIYNN